MESASANALKATQATRGSQIPEISASEFNLIHFPVFGHTV